jgi:hypothetical protein
MKHLVHSFEYTQDPHPEMRTLGIPDSVLHMFVVVAA